MAPTDGEDLVSESRGVTLLVKGIGRSVTEEALKDALSRLGNVVALKMIPKRRIAFAEFGTASELQAVLATGSSFELGDSQCFFQAASGVIGANTDVRQGGQHVCAECGREFTSRAKLRAHASDKNAHVRADSGGTWHSMDCLDEFDMRPGAMIADLAENHRTLLQSYLSTALPGSPELADIIFEIVEQYPVALRVKELFESVESAKALGNHVQDLREHAQPGCMISEIYDLACGHGLVGILLAYRFPDLTVMGVDLEERPAWSQYLAGFRCKGKPAKGRSSPLQNISFVRGSLQDVKLGPASVAIGVHGCNEANLEVLEQCRSAGAACGVVPCCIPERLYADGDLRITHVPDEIRYAVMIGVIAKQYGASRVTSIDRRITNRNLIVLFEAFKLLVESPPAAKASGYDKMPNDSIADVTPQLENSEAA